MSDNQDQFIFGDRLRKIRIEHRLTLAELSSMSNIPTSSLSRVENGLIQITFHRAISIANALQIPIASLVSEMEPEISGRRAITRATPGGTRVVAKNKLEFEVLCEDIAHKQSFFWKVIVHCDSLEKFGAFSKHPGEEFIYVLDGELELHCDPYKPVRLTAGDSTFFDGSMPHAYIKVGKTSPILLMANTVKAGMGSKEAGS